MLVPPALPEPDEVDEGLVENVTRLFIGCAVDGVVGRDAAGVYKVGNHPVTAMQGLD